MSSSRQPQTVRRRWTTEGIPLDLDRPGTVPFAANDGDGGPARRILCQPKLCNFTTAPSPALTPPTKPLTVGPALGSLIDDNDDELVDYSGANVSIGQAALPPDGAASPSSRWNVREGDVRTLPSFYPLEKSSVFVPRASASAIAARIVSVLQDRSVGVAYDARNAKVDCVSESHLESESHVEFRVRLYRGRGGKYNQGIIVEVQRRYGFELSYFQDVYAILDAAQGDLKGPI